MLGIHLKTCLYCKKQISDLKYCKGCRNASYCGGDCQKMDWTRHSVHCRMFKDQNLPDFHIKQKDASLSDDFISSLKKDPQEGDPISSHTLQSTKIKDCIHMSPTQKWWLKSLVRYKCANSKCKKPLPDLIPFSNLVAFINCSVHKLELWNDLKYCTLWCKNADMDNPAIVNTACITPPDNFKGREVLFVNVKIDKS